MLIKIAKLTKLSSRNKNVFPQPFHHTFNVILITISLTMTVHISMIPFYFLLNELPEYILSLLLNKTNLFHILFSKCSLYIKRGYPCIC